MTVQRQIFSRIATCKAKLAQNNTITVDSEDREATNVEPGDQVRVRLTRTDLGSTVKPRDSDFFDTTVQKTHQIYVPLDTIQKLDLEAGDIVHYVVVPKKSFPGLQDGPVRNVIKSTQSRQGEAETISVEPEQTRETSNAEYQGNKMQKTGQVTVPAEIRDKMAVSSGDTVLATIEWQGDDTSFNVDIDSRNRITIPKSERNKLGLEAGDKPKVTLAVF